VAFDREGKELETANDECLTSPMMLFLLKNRRQGIIASFLADAEVSPLMMFYWIR
jgi:hypothetical protein